MALDTRSRGRWWSRLHFLVRFTGLTGLLLAGAGLALALVDGVLTWETIVVSWERLQALVQGQDATAYPDLAISLLLIGVVAGLFALVVEMIVVLRVVAGRRSALGFNAAVQIALAALLLVGLNVWSFDHYLRWDWTWGGKFTLPEDVQQQLRQLSEEQGKTTIVVYQRHRTFGRFSDKADDAYDSAAEQKVSEKVQDLVDQFRELGPQFEVVVLDVKDKEYEESHKEALEDEEPVLPSESGSYRSRGKGYAEKVEHLPAELKAALENVQENTIFFHARGRVQRMSFNDFYRLDKAASHRERNLVLSYQGVEPFARQVLTIEQRQPRIGIAIVHEVFGSHGAMDSWTFAGAGQALAAKGFVVRDVILKQGLDRRAPLGPIVATYEERKYADLERRISILDTNIKVRRDAVNELVAKVPEVVGGALCPEAAALLPLAPGLIWQEVRDDAVDLQDAITQLQTKRTEFKNEQASLEGDRIAEQRRMSDLKAKFDRTLADLDLLIVPRLTLRDLMRDDKLPNRLYGLDAAQVASIRDYLKSGRPVLALFGPSNEDPDDASRMDSLGPPGADGLEDLLTELGLRFSKQTVLYLVEEETFSKQRANPFESTGDAPLPPVRFRWQRAAKRPAPSDAESLHANPLGESLYLTSRSIGQPLDLPVRHPRPIYFTLDKGRYLSPAAALLVGGGDVGVPAGLPWAGLLLSSQKIRWPDAQASFILTDPKAWNEDQPFPTTQRLPHYEKPKPGDRSIGTLDEVRRGQFPIAVAVETPVPLSWTVGRGQQPVVRVAAIGQGGIFSGLELKPANEKLLLDTCNWLLGRDDALARNVQVWEYPRVDLTPREYNLWRWAAWLGLPGLFAYLGFVVVLVRRLR